MLERPGTVTNPYLYDATDNQLQEFVVLCICVAGKKATIQQEKVFQFSLAVHENIERHDPSLTLFERIVYLSPEDLMRYLVDCKMGQYGRVSRAIRWLGKRIINGSIDLRQCTREELTHCPGIGYKTASMFLNFTRKHCSYACLDTHILKWLRNECGYSDAPKNSPGSPGLYAKWETVYLEEAKNRNKDATELDLELWLRYSGSDQKQ